jgi:hypothetical protein
MRSSEGLAVSKLTTTTVLTTMETKAPATAASLQKRAPTMGTDRAPVRKVVGHRQGPHHVADDEGDDEDHDAHQQGGYAACQDFVVFAPGDETSVDAVGEDRGGGQKTRAGGGHDRRQRGCQDLCVALGVPDLLLQGMPRHRRNLSPIHPKFTAAHSHRVNLRENGRRKPQTTTLW